MKKLILALVILALAVPAYADRTACNAALVTDTVCRNNSDILWSLSVSQAADAKLQAALAKKAGWTAQVACTQAMVDLAQCTVGQLGTQVTNPVTERNAAKAEFKRMLKDDFIRSYDAEQARAAGAAVTASGLAAITDPDTGN